MAIRLIVVVGDETQEIPGKMHLSQATATKTGEKQQMISVLFPQDSSLKISYNSFNYF